MLDAYVFCGGCPMLQFLAILHNGPLVMPQSSNRELFGARWLTGARNARPLDQGIGEEVVVDGNLDWPPASARGRCVLDLTPDTAEPETVKLSGYNDNKIITAVREVPPTWIFNT